MLKINSIATTFVAIAILSSLLGSCIPEIKNDDKPPVAISPSAAPKNLDSKSVATTKPETPKKTDTKIEKIKIDGLETYKHPSGLFQIDVPKGWIVKEKKNLKEIFVLWIDPTKNALVLVDIFVASKETNNEQLTTLLEAFLKSTYASRPKFTTEKPVQLKDGSIQIVWTCDEVVKDVTAKIQSSSFISRNGDKISMITTSGVAAQTSEFKEYFDRVVNSYKVDPAVSIP
jgi:hypothetical protein